jgi:hypothetical protein
MSAILDYSSADYLSAGNATVAGKRAATGGGYVEHCNDVRPNRAIGYITPKDVLNGRQREIHADGMVRPVRDETSQKAQAVGGRNPRPFGFAQGRLFEKPRRPGQPQFVWYRQGRVGQPAADLLPANSISVDQDQLAHLRPVAVKTNRCIVPEIWPLDCDGFHRLLIHGRAESADDLAQCRSRCVKGGMPVDSDRR